MSIAAVYCVYNEEEYIEYSIRSILESVDQIYVLLSQGPYTAYNPRAEERFAREDRTAEIVSALAARHRSITLVRGLWRSELEHRNAGMQLAWRDGHAYYFLVDGDEVYRADHLGNLRQAVKEHPRVGQFIIKCDLFWRSFRYRIPYSELSWMPRRLFRMTRWSRLGKSQIPIPWRCRFTGNNKTDSWGSVLHLDPGQIRFYHFSFARSPAKMLEKLSTYSHAHEIRERWFEDVWLRWPTQRDLRNLNPVDPPKMPAALRVEPDDLPEIMRRHPYYALDVIE